MRQIIIFLIALVALSQTYTKSYEFHKDGTYKIAQFTDVHFNHKKSASQTSLRLFDEVLSNEKPDLVVLSGDIVVDDITPENNSWKTILRPFQNAGVDVAI